MLGRKLWIPLDLSVQRVDVCAVCRMVAPKLRNHPSGSVRVRGADREYTAQVSRILTGVAHRLPPTPGAECSLTEAEKAYREEHNEEIEQMRRRKRIEQSSSEVNFPHPRNH